MFTLSLRCKVSELPLLLIGRWRLQATQRQSFHLHRKQFSRMSESGSTQKKKTHLTLVPSAKGVDHIMGRLREKVDFRIGLIQQCNNTIKQPVFFQHLPSRMAALSLSSLPHGGKRASRVLILATTIIFPFDIGKIIKAKKFFPQDIPRKFSFCVIPPNWITFPFLPETMSGMLWADWLSPVSSETVTHGTRNGITLTIQMARAHALHRWTAH